MTVSSLLSSSDRCHYLLVQHPESILALFSRWKRGHFFVFSFCRRRSTHAGLLHCLLRERTPPPQVLEQEPNFDQEPQLPSWPWGCWLDLQMQWPLKHHWNITKRTKRSRLMRLFIFYLLPPESCAEQKLNCNSKQIQRDFPPFPVRTLFHPPEDLFWFYKSTGCRGDCTTVACKGRTFETEWEESHFELESLLLEMWTGEFIDLLWMWKIHPYWNSYHTLLTFYWSMYHFRV